MQQTTRRSQGSRHHVTKVLAVVGLVGAALAVGRCWGRNSAATASPPSSLGVSSSVAASPGPVASATASKPSQPDVAIHLDAGGIRLLPDSTGLRIPVMPSLDPEQLLRGEVPDAGAPAASTATPR